MKKEAQMINIDYHRESVCAADDYVNHSIKIVLPMDATLNDLVNYIHNYLEGNYSAIPYTGGNSWWALKSDNRILAYVNDKKTEIQYPQYDSQTPLKDLDVKEVYGTRNL